MEQKPTNDRANPVTKFCLAMEEHRRTPEGRVRAAKDLVSHFFPHDQQGADDRLFRFMPNDVRGPILSAWGIRGTKAALRDDDAKVRTVVFDALVAGDIDEATFEEGISPQILTDWVALSDWWTFWRKGKLTGVAIQKALATARELGLIDDKWFFSNLEGRGGKLKGTDVVCDTLSKEQVVAWLKNVHASGDGSPKGLVAAIGWETILHKTAEDALLFALDAFAKKAGLVAESEAAAPKAAPPAAEPPAAPPTPVPSSSASAEKTTAAEPAITTVPTAPADESPKLAEARAQMLQMLDQPAPAVRKPHDESEAPGRPSSLEWPEPPGVATPPVPTEATSGVEIIPIEEVDDAEDAPSAPKAGKPAVPPAAAAKKLPIPRAR